MDRVGFWFDYRYVTSKTLLSHGKMSCRAGGKKEWILSSDALFEFSGDE